MISTFIAASTLICLAPGPSILVVVKSSIEGGLRRGLVSILGVILADALLLSLSMSGLGVIIHSSQVLYIVLKYMSAAYLIYLGCSTLLKKDNKSINRNDSAFLGAVGVTMLNPKIIGFFIAFFPQFIDQQESLSSQLAILGPLFLLIVFVVLLAYALFADVVKDKLKQGVWNRAFKITTALSLIACGVMAIPITS